MIELAGSLRRRGSMDNRTRLSLAWDRSYLRYFGPGGVKGHLMPIAQVILVRDGRIQAVGPSLEAPQNASLIDLSTQTVLPGLIDCHTQRSVKARAR
jgi:imidazolonepropionase-like amidohydrolase